MTEGQLTAEMAARLLMITDRHLRQLAADGWIKKTPDGHYTLVAVVQGHIRYLKDRIGRSTRMAADGDYRRVKIREAEVRLAERERTLVPLNEAFAIVDEVIGGLRAGLAGLPASLTRDLALRRRIEDGLNGELARTAGRLRKAAGSAAADGGSSGADGAPDAGRVGKAKPKLPGKRRVAGAKRPKPDALHDPDRQGGDGGRGQKGRRGNQRKGGED